MKRNQSADLFNAYVNELKSKNRFFPDEKFLRLFDRIINSPDNRKILDAGSLLYRARGNELHKRFVKISDIGINRTNPMTNRASPIGIAYMYLSEEVETAIAEIRPNVNQIITVGTFKTTKALSFLTLENSAAYSGTVGDEFDSLDVVGFILRLAFSFATPVSGKAEVDYLPCQFFAEYCKRNGVAGIRYISAAKGLHWGTVPHKYNYVLFDDSTVEFVEAREFSVRGISYDIDLRGYVSLEP